MSTLLLMLLNLQEVVRLANRGVLSQVVFKCWLLASGCFKLYVVAHIVVK